MQSLMTPRPQGLPSVVARVLDSSLAALTVLTGCSMFEPHEPVPARMCGLPSKLFQDVAGEKDIELKLMKAKFPVKMSRPVHCWVSIDNDAVDRIEVSSVFDNQEYTDDRRESIASGGDGEILKFGTDGVAIYRESDNGFSASSVCGQVSSTITGPVVPGAHRKDRIALVEAILNAAGCATYATSSPES